MEEFSLTLKSNLTLTAVKDLVQLTVGGNLGPVRGPVRSVEKRPEAGVFRADKPESAAPNSRLPAENKLVVDAYSVLHPDFMLLIGLNPISFHRFGIPKIGIERGGIVFNQRVGKAFFTIDDRGLVVRSYASFDPMRQS